MLTKSAYVSAATGEGHAAQLEVGSAGEGFAAANGKSEQPSDVPDQEQPSQPPESEQPSQPDRGEPILDGPESNGRPEEAAASANGGLDVDKMLPNLRVSTGRPGTHAISNSSGFF